MAATKVYGSVQEWTAEAVKRFGPDKSKWAFICPACKHVAKTTDWKRVGAPSTAVAFSCVGRWMDNPRRAFGDEKKPGPCDYAGAGLFGINPVQVKSPEGEIRVFDFAPTEAADGAQAGE